MPIRSFNQSNTSGSNTLLSSIGCDSIVNVNLTFTAPNNGFVTEYPCQGSGFSVTVGSDFYDESKYNEIKYLIIHFLKLFLLRFYSTLLSTVF